MCGKSVLFIATVEYYTSVCLSGESYALECVGNKTGSALTSLTGVFPAIAHVGRKSSCAIQEFVNEVRKKMWISE